MDIKLMINRALIDAKRNGTRLEKVILGKEERKFLHEQIEINEDLEVEENAWSLKVEYVDKESYFEAINEEKDELM